jgi:SET domain-containing protein
LDNPKVILKTHEFGKGLFAKEKIFSGEVIAEFDGEIYTDDISDNDKWNQDLNDHCIQFSENAWRYSKGIAVFSNHSCNPNCGIKNLFQIVAMRDINSGEEITWDYEMTEDNETENEKSFYFWAMDCKCGSENCRGKIGSYKNMPEETRKRYKGFISDWLIQKYGETK